MYIVTARRVNNYGDTSKCEQQLNDFEGTLNSKSKYTLCYLMSTQKKGSLEIQNWLGLMRIGGPLPSEYSANLKVYTFFWS